MSAVNATQVDRRNYAAIAAEERPEPSLRLGHLNAGQSDHVTLVKPISALIDHIASFQRETGSKPEEQLLRN